MDSDVSLVRYAYRLRSAAAGLDTSTGAQAGGPAPGVSGDDEMLLNGTPTLSELRDSYQTTLVPFAEKDAEDDADLVLVAYCCSLWFVCVPARVHVRMHACNTVSMHVSLSVCVGGRV